MKFFYVFLDVDGVLNDFNYWNKCKERNGTHQYMNGKYYPFNPESLNNLMLLGKNLLKHKAIMRIILSSTWRLDESSTEIVKSRLAEYSMTIYDQTPNIMLNKRQEIKTWLASNKNPKMYLVIDDNKEMLSIFDEINYINTDTKYGFNEEKLKEALKKVEVQYGETIAK